MAIKLLICGEVEASSDFLVINKTFVYRWYIWDIQFVSLKSVSAINQNSLRTDQNALYRYLRKKPQICIRKQDIFHVFFLNKYSLLFAF